MQVTVQVLVGYRVQDLQSIVQLPRGQLWTPNFTQILEVGRLLCFSMIQVRKRELKRNGKGIEKEWKGNGMEREKKGKVDFGHPTLLKCWQI